MFRNEKEFLDKVSIFKDTNLLKPKYLCASINFQPNTNVRTLWVFPLSECCAIHTVPESVIFKTSSLLRVGREIETWEASERVPVDSSLALGQEALKSLLPDMVSGVPGYWVCSAVLRSLCNLAWSRNSHSLIQHAMKSSNLPCYVDVMV